MLSQILFKMLIHLLQIYKKEDLCSKNLQIEELKFFLEILVRSAI